MFNHYITCLKKYAVFSGRATRSEYWYFALVNFIVSIVLGLLGLELISQLYTLFVLIPGWAVFFRRMHDINRSGWNWLWCLLPIIGWIILLIYSCTPTKEGENKYTMKKYTMKKKDILEFSQTSPIEVVLYILSSLIFIISCWTISDNFDDFVFSRPIYFICSIIPFIILFKKSLRLHDWYLLPFFFLLPLLTLYKIRTFGLLSFMSFFTLLSRQFLIFDLLGLFILLKHKKTQEERHDKPQEERNFKQNIRWRLCLSLILVILFLFITSVGCSGLGGCIMQDLIIFTSIILFCFIFPGKTIVSLILSRRKAKSSK